MLDGFKTARGEKLFNNELINEIKKFISENDKFDYRILVGTDSEHFDHHIDFVSVIVVHRVGQGARYFWKREIYKQKFGLQERLWREAMLSLTISQEIISRLSQENLTFHFEVHLDLGTKGKSFSSLREIINLIRNYGFEVKIKPHSYAASKIADRLI